MNPDKIKLRNTVALAILFLPLFFVYLNNFHDWGDDFAQYLIQAKFYSNTIPSMLVSDLNGYSPSVKGQLFSVLLMPVIEFPSYELLIGKVIITCSLIFLGIMFFMHLQRSFNMAASLVMTAFFTYDYHLLILKDQLLPDFFFAALILSIALVMESKKTAYSLWIPLLIALISIGFRSVGIAAVVAVLLTSVTNRFRSENQSVKKFNWSKITLIIILSGLVLTGLIYSGSSDSISWYVELITGNLSAGQVGFNCSVYYDGLRMFFEQEIPAAANTILWWIVFLPMLLGFILKLVRNKGFTEYFVMLYLLIILIYPYHKEPVRFLLPILAPLLIYCLNAYSWLFQRFIPSYKKHLILAFTCVLMVSMLKNTLHQFKKTPVYPPFSATTHQAFDFIKKEIPLNEKIAFRKPWALAYFTNHKTVPIVSASKAKWVLVDVSDDELMGKKNQMGNEIVFKNSEYAIYHQKSENTNIVNGGF